MDIDRLVIWFIVRFVNHCVEIQCYIQKVYYFYVCFRCYLKIISFKNPTQIYLLQLLLTLGKCANPKPIIAVQAQVETQILYEGQDIQPP